MNIPLKFPNSSRTSQVKTKSWRTLTRKKEIKLHSFGIKASGVRDLIPLTSSYVTVTRICINSGKNHELTGGARAVITRIPGKFSDSSSFLTVAYSLSSSRSFFWKKNYEWCLWINVSVREIIVIVRLSSNRLKLQGETSMSMSKEIWVIVWESREKNMRVRNRESEKNGKWCVIEILGTRWFI